MLTVAKVTQTSAAGYADYLEGKATAPQLGDYYLRDGERVEAAGRWVAGADRVGCDPGEVVGGDALRALMAVCHPVTGQALRRMGGDGTAVAAIDATFSAPKSVSAVWALSDSDLRAQIEAAHEQAVDQAVVYARERVAMIRERTDGAVIHTHAAGVVATAWRHTTARAVDGQAPDPQLHSHVLLHAAARRDGGLVAIDSRAWLIHRRELGAAYRTHLAHELAELGFGIERGTGRGCRYFEIAGVPQALLDRWSSRHHQVREAIENRLAQKEIELQALITEGGPDAATAQTRLQALERSRTLTAAENRLAGVSTRTAKTPTTVSDLDRDWAHTADQAGFASRDLDRLRTVATGELLPVSPSRLVGALTELHATFTDRDARAIAIEQSAGANIDSALTVLDQAQATGELLGLAEGQTTTRRQRAAEQRTVEAAEVIALDAAQPIPPQTVEAEIIRLEAEVGARGGIVTNEQRDAVRIACGEARLVVIDGQAGTGKSTVLRAVARAHQQVGQEILVTSTAALAAQRLAGELTEAGVRCNDYSTVALARAVKAGTVEVGPQTTVIHDEAALASTKELEPLAELIRDGGGRLVLVGDPHQSHPVGAGGLWPHLERIATSTDAHAQLTRNVRAHDRADRHDQELFRAGEHLAALAGYQHRGRLHTATDRTAIEDDALEAAQADREAGRRTVVITQTSNDHLDALNARAQALRLANGELGLHALNLDGRPYGLRAGDHIQIRRTIHPADYGPLRNGTPATITSIDPDTRSATVELADGRSLSLRDDELDRAQARLAYVQHPFPAQGTTVDTAHLIVGEHITQQGTYVGLTRARDQTHIYHPTPDINDDDQDALADIAQHVGRDEHDPPSIAFALAHTPRPGPEGLGSAAWSDDLPSRQWPREPEPPALLTPSWPHHERESRLRENDQGWEP